MGTFALNVGSILRAVTIEQKKTPYSTPSLLNLSSRSPSSGSCYNGSGDSSLCMSGTNALGICHMVGSGV